MFPEFHGLARLATVPIAFAVPIAMFFVPRLWADDAILDRAREHATARATQNN